MALMQKLQIYRYNIDMYIYIYEYGTNLGIASTKKNLWHPPPESALIQSIQSIQSTALVVLNGDGIVLT